MVAQDALCQAVKDWPVPGKQNLKRVPVSSQAIRNQFAVIQMRFDFAILVRVFVLQRSRHYASLISIFPGTHQYPALRKTARPEIKAATGWRLMLYLIPEIILAFACQFVSLQVQPLQTRFFSSQSDSTLAARRAGAMTFPLRAQVPE
jgi:hypothetical protein